MSPSRSFYQDGSSSGNDAIIQQFLMKTHYKDKYNGTLPKINQFVSLNSGPKVRLSERH